MLPVFMGFGAVGFSWFAGLAATRHEYLVGVASRRPYRYFLFADLAAFALALGPAAVVAIARLRDRRVWLLVGAALGAIAVADLSGMSKAEVERIWLPFVPWALLATCGVRGESPACGDVRVWLGLAGRDRGPYRAGGTVPMVTDAPTAAEIPVTAARVLVVEDDRRCVRSLGGTSSAKASSSTRSPMVSVALEHAEACWPDLVILDLMLPGLDGLGGMPAIAGAGAGSGDHAHGAWRRGRPSDGARARCRRLHREAVLAARADPSGASGAAPRGRRGSRPVPSSSRASSVADLDIDVRGREVFRAGDRLSLTAREFDLLVYFASHPRRVFRREELLEDVWGFSYGDTATVTVHVRRLREKIEADPADADAPHHRVGRRATGGIHEPVTVWCLRSSRWLSAGR